MYMTAVWDLVPNPMISMTNEDEGVILNSEPKFIRKKRPPKQPPKRDWQTVLKHHIRYGLKQFVEYNGQPYRVENVMIIEDYVVYQLYHLIDKTELSQVSQRDVKKAKLPKHKLNQQYIVVGKNGHNGEIVTLVDIVRDVCFVRNQQGETFQTNPFEINRFNY